MPGPVSGFVNNSIAEFCSEENTTSDGTTVLNKVCDNSLYVRKPKSADKFALTKGTVFPGSNCKPGEEYIEDADNALNDLNSRGPEPCKCLF